MEAVRGLVQDDGPIFFQESLNPRLATLFLREKTFKRKSVGGQATRSKSRNKGRWAGKRGYFQIRVEGRPDK